jgi:PhzF family phenazine biosynthesis protein
MVMNRKIPFKQVDVFGTLPFMGNPVAVILDAETLSAAEMQRIANWTNLSETTFVLPATLAGADYRVRIFTPRAELPFAGHPTLGTAHALLEAGRIKPGDHGHLVQECGAGLVRLQASAVEGRRSRIAFELPEPWLAPLDGAEIAALETALGGPVSREPAPMRVDVGPVWLVAELADARSVLALRPDFGAIARQSERLDCTGITVYGRHPRNAQAAIEVRAFAPAHGVDEDPVCGSGTGSVGAFIRHAGQRKILGDAFLAAQGAALGRAGMIGLALSDDAIRVGGTATTCMDGELIA